MVLSSVAIELQAQRRGGFAPQIRMATPADNDGAFHFCRVAYRSGRGDGGGWGVDYPAGRQQPLDPIVRADQDAGQLRRAREPNQLVVRLTDDELFQCPFVMMTEVGATYLDDEEVTRLREYLLKGGFLWADDFWGSYAWQSWEDEMRKVLPSGQYPIVDLPLDHPLFRTHFIVKKVPQIPSINHWMGSGGGTSERGPTATSPPRAILDANGRQWC